MFQLVRWRPRPELAEFVERHWAVSWDLPPGTGFTQELLPHPCVNLVSEPGRVAVHGIPLSRSRHELHGSGMAIGTKFRPGAFSAFVDVPARHLVDRSLELTDLFGEAGGRLEERLHAAAGDPRAHVSVVENFLLRRLPAADPRRQLLLSVVADMLSGYSSLSVASLAAAHGISQRSLQRLFRDFVGVSPKWVLKRYRVHEAAERIAAGEAPDAARLAAELGYFDQPHFVKDFTAQVGCSPHRYAQLCAAARSAAGSARAA